MSVLQAIKKLNISDYFDKKCFFAALLFTTGMYLIEFYLFGIKSKNIDKLLSDDSYALTIFLFSLIFIAGFALNLLFIYAGFISNIFGKILYCFIFCIIILSEYGFQNAVGRFFVQQDIISAFSATSEQRTDYVLTFISKLSIFFCILYLFVSIVLKTGKKRLGVCFFIFFITVNSLFYLQLTVINSVFFDRNYFSNSYGSFWLSTSDYFLLYSITQSDPIRRAAVTKITSDNVAPSNNIIFVFDESVSGVHLSLNGYSRSTTPFLESLRDKKLLLNWGVAASGSTSSHPSYDIMISGASADDVESKGFSGINRMPSIFQYAKAMNYKTYFFDGQMKQYWGGLPEDVNFIDNLITISEIDTPDRIEDWQSRDNIKTDKNSKKSQLKQWEIDKKIALQVRQIISNSKGNFIFIYKRGAHFPYEKNYPQEETFWSPIYKFKHQYEIPPANEYQSIINSYDNSLRFNLDNFFKILCSDCLKPINDSVILYTSDHSESFYLNGKAGHGGETVGEASVPLFILGIDNPKNIDTKFKASHSNLFTTLLDLIEYPQNQRKYPYAVSLLTAKEKDSKQRFFNPATAKKIPFD